MSNLSDTSILIHYRRDSDDREFNLMTIVEFLKDNVDYKELFIINDNKEIDKELFIFKNDPKVKVLFFENHDQFKKSQAFNIGREHSTGDILCFYDVDVLIEPQFLQVARDSIKLGGYDHVYPFTGTFYNIKKTIFDEILNPIDFGRMKQEDVSTSEHVEWASDTSPGGCNLISAEAFDKIGGYDNSFIGWGFEDTDFYERSKKLNKVTYLDDTRSFCWHLDHSSAIRMENPHYEANLRKFVLNRSNPIVKNP